MEEEEGLGVAFRAALVVGFEKPYNAFGQPPPTFLEAALQSREDAKLAVCAGGAVQIGLLLFDGKRFEVPVPR